MKIEVKTKIGNSKIHLKSGVATTIVPPSFSFVLTDEKVYALYQHYFETTFANCTIFPIKSGENYKTIETLQAVLTKMKEANLRRTSCLFAVGGGVVGDIGGLAASLYMRGIDFVQVPTTLLSQVDSGVGGKTAIDFCGVKNLIGSFHLPKQTYIDPAFLSTLERKELLAGLGEVIKCGGLCPAIFQRLYTAKSFCDLPFLTEITPLCVQLKADIIQKDPTEKGERKSLNLGHTTAHAIELSFGVSHGESVLFSLAIETILGMEEGITKREDGERLVELCRACLREFERENISDIRSALTSSLLDKKNEDTDEVAVVLMKKIGKWSLVKYPYEKYVEKVVSAYEIWTNTWWNK